MARNRLSCDLAPHRLHDAGQHGQLHRSQYAGAACSAILRDTGLSNEQYGFVVSGFSIAYMLCNPLWGWIVERIGVRVSMGIAVTFWTLASVSHAFAAGFRGFLAARTALGVGEGASYPGAVRTVTQTLPPKARMRGIAIAYSGGSFGALLTPIIVTPVAAAWGWRAAFWFTGGVGALWLALWAVVSRRRDLARPPTVVVESRDTPRWSDARLWAYIGSTLGSPPLAFVLYQSSIDLSAVMHKSQVEIGHVLWIPPLGWETGFFFWGWVTDRFARSGASICAWRRQFLQLILLSRPLAAVPHVGSYSITLALLFLVMFVAAGFTVSSLAYATCQYSTVLGVHRRAWFRKLVGGAGARDAIRGTTFRSALIQRSICACNADSHPGIRDVAVAA